MAARRDARVAWLPNRLPSQPRFVWKKPLWGPGLGGIAATTEFVFFGDRDVQDRFDEFHCLSAADGSVIWTARYPAHGKLDYGNSPRATPLVVGNLVVFAKARMVIYWPSMCEPEPQSTRSTIAPISARRKNDRGEPAARRCTPKGRLIIHPGATTAAVAAIQHDSGTVVWQTPGEPPAYGSFIAGTFGGVAQIIGHDHVSLGGWELASGQRLWTLVPRQDDDFNVPTPLAVQGRLLVASENNGTRLYGFDDRGRLISEPVATSEELAPDIATPVEAGGLIFGLDGDLVCLDPTAGLRTCWTHTDHAYRTHGSLMATDDRLLVAAANGELILIDVAADAYREIARLKIFDDDDAELYSHPALVGSRLYCRGDQQIVGVDLLPPDYSK